jgi:signal peptidase I
MAKKKPITKKRPVAPKRKSKGAIREWVVAIIVALFLVVALRILVADVAMVKDEQMQSTYASGKLVAISKITPGARVPITLFSWKNPVDSVGNFTGYAFTITLPPIRLWNSKMKPSDRGAVFAFNEPDNNPNIPIDKKKLALGRTVAQPGEIVSIVNGQLLVNKVAVTYPKSANYFYNLKSKENSKALLASNGIEEASVGKDGIVQLYATKEQAKKLKDAKSIASIVHETVDNHHDFVHLLTKFKKGIKLPTKGEKVSLSSDNFEIYAPMIVGGEGQQAELRTDGIYINGSLTTSYTFKNSYYFMLKDNVDNSIDSRSYGPVAESFIVGKVI